jgi:DNA repair exonuclease SbcCD ATPase subunit
MGHLEFQTLIVKNVRTFSGQHELPLNSIGLNLLRGRNAQEPSLGANDAGKTTLWDTFSWVLWGRTPDGLRGADLRPWGGSPKKAGPTAGSVILTHDDARHEVSRVDKTNGLRLDGKAVGQPDIDRLVMPFELATNTILLAQARALFYDKPPREKLDLFADALNLQRWDVRSDFADTKLKALIAANAGLIAERDAKEAVLDDAERAMSVALEKSDAWQQAQGAKIDDYKVQLAEAEKLLEHQAKLKAEADLKYDGAGTEAKALKSEITQLLDSRDAVDRKILQLEAQRDQATKERDKLAGSLKGLTKTGKCPTCQQPVTNKNFDKHKAELEKTLAELDDLLKKGLQKLRSLEKEVATFHRAIKLARDRETEFLIKADEGLSTLRRLGDSITKLEARTQTLKFTIANEEKTKNQHYEQYQAHKDAVARLKRELKEIGDDIKHNDALIARTQPWVKGFKEIKLLIVDETLEELELAANSMLPELGLNGWEVLYDIEKETKSGGIQRALNVSVLSPGNDKPVKWEVWGGGAGQRLRIAGSLSLSDVLLARAGISTNLEILDEPARHMSKEGVRDLCDALSARAAGLQRCIWFVDHMSIESDRFAEVCTVVKDGRGSRLVRG